MSVHDESLLRTYSDAPSLYAVEAADGDFAVAAYNGVCAFGHGNLLRRFVGVHDADDVLPWVVDGCTVEREGDDA